LSARQDKQSDGNWLRRTVQDLLGKFRLTRAPRAAVIGSSVAISDGESQLTLSARRTRQSPSRLRRIIFRVAALTLALVMSCAVVEIGLRICGYGRNYTNPMSSFFEPDGEVGCHGKANFTGRFRRTDFDVVVEHDKNGFRRSEAPADPAAHHDVYVLGDSFVWGYGVGQHDLFTNQMQPLLSDLRVHNLGLIGAGTVQEHLIFQKHVANRLRPGDTVLLVFFGNDFGDNVGRNLTGRTYATIENGKVHVVLPETASTNGQWKSSMKDTSYLFNLIAFSWDRFQHNRAAKNIGTKAMRPSQMSAEIKAFTSDSGPAFQITRHYLSELKNACDAKQVRFLAAYVPGQAEMGEDEVSSTSDLCLPQEIACRQAFERMVRDLAIDTVDLMAPMVAAKRTGRFERMTFVHDFHWNSAGHTIAAEVIAGAMQ
jgi:hypothetical protein